MPTAMQMLNETYIAPSTCAMKTAVTRHQRCGGMSPKNDISPLPAMMALSANSTLLAMIRYNTHSEEYALAGDALKLAPHDEAEGDEKNSGQNIYGTFFHLHPS